MASVETLREGVLRLDASFEQAPVGLAHVLPDGTIQRLNASAAALLGVPRDAAAGRPLPDFVHPDDRAALLAGLLRLVAGTRETLDVEVRLLAGTDLPLAAPLVRCAAALVRDPVAPAGAPPGSGAPFFCVVVLEALGGEHASAAARTREAARREAAVLVARARDEADRRLRAALDTMLDCVGIYTAMRDADGRITDFRVDYVNDAACANNRLTREQQLGRGLCELLPAHRDLGLFDAYVEVVETRTPLEREWCLYRDTYGDGEMVERAFDIRAVPLGDGFVAAWRDVTPRARDAHALRVEQRQLDAALVASMAGTWSWRLGEEQVTWDGPMRRLTGIGPDEPVTLARFLAMIHPEDRARVDASSAALAAGEGVAVEFRLVPEGGSPEAPRWVLDRGEPVRDAAGRVVAVRGSVMDVTELVEGRRRAERLLAFTAALAAAEGAEAVYDALVAHGSAAVGAPAAAVVRLAADDPTTCEIVRAVGYAEGALAEWTRFPLDAASPMGDALRRGEPVWLGSQAEAAQRYPALRGILDATGFEGWLAIPFVLGEGDARRVLGGLGVAYAAPQAVSDAERAFLVALGRQAAQALDRVRAESALRASEARGRAIVENLPVGAAFVVDHDLRYVLAGGEALRSAGFASEDFVGRTLADVLEPTLVAHYGPLYRRALGGETFMHEHEAHGRTYVSRGTPLRDADGRVTAALAVSYDITERRAAEAERERLVGALEAERDRVRDVFDRAPGFAALLQGPDHVFTYANAPYVRLVGDRPLLGRPVREALPEVEGQGFFELLDRVRRTGEPFTGREMPLTLRHAPDAPAAERLLDFVYQPLLGADGTPDGIIVHGIDVTDSVRARLAVEAERELLAHLIDALPVLVTVYDPALAVGGSGGVQFNRAFRDTLGWTDEDAAAGDIMARCYPDPAVRAAAASHMQRAPLVAEGAPDEAARWLELPTRTKDGRTVPVLWTNIRLAGDRQVGVGVDLSERKAAEAAVAAERALLRAVIEQLPVGISIAEAPDGAVLLGNALGERLLGHGLDRVPDVAAYGTLGGVHADGTPYAPDDYPTARALRGETVQQETMRYQRGDGSLTHLAVSAAPVFDADGTLVRAVCVWSDVHERVALEEALRRARDAAHDANRAKSEFLASMSHELRTPLNAIQGHVQLLDMELHGPLTDAQREALGRVTRAQRHLLGLINDVLNYAKLEAGRVEYHVERVALADPLREAAALMEPQVTAAGLALRATLPSPGLAVRADVDKLRQIVLNLLSNALKFTPAGGELALGVEVPTDAPDTVRIHVRDTGIGIAPDKHQAVFEPFVQVGSAPGRLAQGTGLGLAISRDLARGMGGDLTLASAPGAGSTFTLTLRRADDPPGAPPARTPTDAAAAG